MFQREPLYSALIKIHRNTISDLIPCSFPRTLLSVLMLVSAAPLLHAEMPDDRVVFREGKKKRIHVAKCKRYQRKDPATFTKMTYGEAKKLSKKLDFCSKCPVLRKGEVMPESWVNPPPERETIQTHPFVPPANGPVVSMGSDGRLVYKPYSSKGDRVLDWSYVGYKQSEVPLPEVPVKITLSAPGDPGTADGVMRYPKGPDSSQVIQEALNTVGAMPADEKGSRGAVLLKKGVWFIYSTIKVPSGVVLRGEGDTEQGTVIIGKGSAGGRGGSKAGVMIVVGAGTQVNHLEEKGAVWIEDVYVPSSSKSLTVADASQFKPGDMVSVKKMVNQRWIDDFGMGVRLRHIRAGLDGLQKKPWVPERYQFSHIREVTAVEGNTLTFDMPLPQSFDAKHGGGKVYKVDASGLSTHSGAESLLVKSDYDTTAKDESKGSIFKNYWSGIVVSAARDSWVRDCTVKHISFTAVHIQSDSMYVTVRDCKYLEPIGVKRGGHRYAFCIAGGTGHLVYRCYAEDSRHCFAGGAGNMGPYAFVKCESVRGGQSEPHHRWGTGFLYDNVETHDGRIAVINRGDSGTGHGWAAANCMIWNSNATGIIVFDPETEGENNFAIGYTGPKREEYDTTGIYYSNTRSGYWGTEREGKFFGLVLSGNGHIESPDKPVEPGSLFIQQLYDRIGKEQAMKVLK